MRPIPSPLWDGPICYQELMGPVAVKAEPKNGFRKDMLGRNATFDPERT